MNTSELLQIVARGEDSKHQFKTDVTNSTSLASEMVAFSNGSGGEIFIGVADDGTLRPHDGPSVRRLNALISNAAADCVRPAIDPVTENVAVDGGVVIVVTVPEGLSKPYMDNTGAIWVKSGSDKRRGTSREEIQRMFQSAQFLHGDDIPVPGTSVADVELEYFREFFRSRFEENLDELNIPLSQVLSNMRLLAEDRLTVTGVLLFAKQPQVFLPAFHVKAVSYPGIDIHTSRYLESEDILGRMHQEFERAMAFILRHLRREQSGQGINSLGELEIPRIVMEELLANAFIHRDYFISAPIRVFVFDDRVEIISPGHLPNNLTVSNIRLGTSNMRNPILSSFATRVLPYRGLGTGIVRAIRVYPDIDLEDDRDRSEFRAIIRRHAHV